MTTTVAPTAETASAADGTRPLPLVSIVTTTYQHSEFIAAALDSALAQTYPNYEIIVADDGSTDGAWEIIQSYGRRYPDRIRVLPRKENSGITGILDNARRAFAACRGKYIAILEGDDLYLPEKLERQVAWMEEDERRVLCAHDTDEFDSDTGVSRKFSELHHPLCSGVGPERFIADHPFATVSVMVRASSMPPYSVDPRLTIAADWMLFFDCLAGGGTFGYVEGVHARHRRHANNLTSRIRDVHMADFLKTIDLMEERRPDLAAACRTSRASLLYGWGVLCLRQGNMTDARTSLRRSLQQRLGLKPLLAAIVALFPESIAAPFARWYGRR